MEFKNGTFFESSVICREWYFALLDCGWALKWARLLLLFAHFCRPSLSCRFCPLVELWNLTSKGTSTQRGQSLHINSWPWTKKSPQSWLCWNSPSALPWLASSTSHQGRMRTEHGVATFKTELLPMLQNSEVAVGFFEFYILIFKFMFPLITWKD